MIIRGVILDYNTERSEQMFDRRIAPRRPTSPTAASRIAAVCLATGILTTPVLAGTDISIPCKETTEVNLKVSVNTLVTTVSAPWESSAEMAPSNDEHPTESNVKIRASVTLLVPRAEAAIREAFSDSDEVALHTHETPFADAILSLPVATTETSTVPNSIESKTVESDPQMNTVLPGVSEDDLSRYKKQMFRRDI